MAIFGGEIVRITDHQVYYGQEVLNVYYYVAGTDFAGATASTIAGAWWATIGLQITPIQHIAVEHLYISCESLDGSMDVGEYVVPTAEANGERTGSPLSSFDTIPFTLRPENRQVRPGGKRICGVSEDDIEDGGRWTVAFATILDGMKGAFAQQFDTGVALDVLLPRIVGFPNANRPTRVEVPISGVTIAAGKSTQNTRKIGHGS